MRKRCCRCRSRRRGVRFYFVLTCDGGDMYLRSKGLSGRWSKTHRGRLLGSWVAEGICQQGGPPTVQSSSFDEVKKDV